MEQNNEIFEDNTPQNSNNKVVIGVFIFLTFAIIGATVAYYFNVQKSVEKELAAKGEIPEEKKINQELARVYEERISSLMKKVEDQQNEIKRLSQMLGDSKNVTQSVTKIQKPKSIIVAECTDMSVGKWQITEKCKQDLLAGIENTLKNTKDILAWEVVPIVDERPYKGSSPELKQEGLASFRTKDARELLDNIDKEDSLIFKGLTLKIDQKRGFKLKAYHLPEA